MGKTAFIFTGQGSQVTGMGKDFFENFSCSKNVFQKFDEVLNKNISNLCFNGTEEELKNTINAQPCILAVEIAILEALKSANNIKADFVAGHSLGEYAALYASNVLSIENTAKLIQARANAMSKVSGGMMSAIIGLTNDELEEIVKTASIKGYVDIANYNTPQQTVITGEKDAVIYANQLATEKGAKRVVPLAVSGAFHSKLMQSAADEFKIAVDKTDISDADIPVITNVDAKETINAEDFREKMPKQITSSVRWVQTLTYLKEHDVDNFIEIGPNKILTGMVRKTLTDVEFSAICNINDFEKFDKREVLL